MPLPNLIDAVGQLIPLDRELASGGEGIVYTLRGDDSRVVKVYRQAPTSAKGDKLRWMVDHASEKLATVAAWPTGLVYSAKQLAGFVMPKLVGFEPIQHLYNPAQRQVYYPSASWAFLVAAARNCAAAFDELHQTGVIIGDVNQSNVWVSEQALARFIDCDSFQVTANGHHHLCEVGVAHYTPPELQGKSFVGLLRTLNHDRFGLAVLLFQMLMVGRHPYAGVDQSRGELPFGEAIAGFRFAHGPRAADMHLLAPPFTPSLDELPSAFLALFRRAFERGSENGDRPTAREWQIVLTDLLDHLRPCQSNEGHWFWIGAACCPWCRIVEERGPDYFLGVSEPTAGFIPDVTRGREGLRRLQLAGVPGEPYTRELLTPVYTAPTPLPPGIVNRYPLAAILAQVCVVCLTVVALGCGFSGVGVAWYVLVGSLGIFAVAGIPLVGLLAISPCFREFRHRRRRLDRAEEDLRSREREYARGAGKVHMRYQERTRQANALLARLWRMPTDYRQELDQLTGRAMELAREAYLRTIFIADAVIPLVDADILWKLALYNICTVADLDPLALDQIEALDPAVRQALLGWRDQQARGFRFGRSRSMPDADRRALMSRYRREQSNLFAQVEHLLAELEAYSPLARDEATQALDELQESVWHWAQAEADFALIRLWSFVRS